MELLADPDAWISLLTLTAMEIVLGIDNIVFIAILTSKVAPERQAGTRRVGLLLALISRLALLFSISWIMTLTAPLFAVFGHGFSGRQLILLAGGLFLIAKATFEIHARLEVPDVGEGALPPRPASTTSVAIQIMFLDIVFSLDSVITAVGMAEHLVIMASAVVLAVAVMLVFAGPVSAFVDRNPTVKVLALSFLILIGVMLVAEGLGQHISKAYVYFAMAFSLLVELINMRARKAQRMRLNPNAPP